MAHEINGDPEVDTMTSGTCGVLKRRVLVRDLNPHLTCSLCEGYLIDATAINECLHTFCRSCIVRYLESSKYCPTCDILVHKNKPLSALKPDRIIQLLVYKLIPSVYQNEVKRRAEFYINARASSSCSEDSILTDSHTETPEESIFSHIQSSISDFFSPDDSISLSLEYYNEDTNSDAKRTSDISLILEPDSKSHEQNNNESKESEIVPGTTVQDKNENIVHKRYLQCPAGVNIKHLSKFIRMKYGLSFQHRVDIIYEDEILPKYFTLMDVAYTFKYKRSEPMRFMYRIFESVPARKFQTHQQQIPLTTSPSPKSSKDDKDSNRDSCSEDRKDTEHQQNSINSSQAPNKPSDEEKHDEAPQLEEMDDDDMQEFAKKRDLEWANLIREQREENDMNNKKGNEETEEEDEEEVFEELSKLRSGSGIRVRRSSSTSKYEKKRNADANISEKKHEKKKHDAGYRRKSLDDGFGMRYEETKSKKNSTKHQGLKHLHKKLESLEDTGKHKKSGEDNETYSRKSDSKKRKKSKHSRHLDTPKRRRLHAEIQTQFNSNEKEDILKLKVKLTPPSVQKIHKHKHIDDSSSQNQSELSAKERLLQMRQVRHKNINQNSETKTSNEKLEQPEQTVTNSDTDSKEGSSKKVRFDIESQKEVENVPIPKIDTPVPTVPPPAASPSASTRKCVPKLIAPNSFTVSKVVSGEKRKLETTEQFSASKVPSLEITLINTTQKPVVSLTPNKNFPTKPVMKQAMSIQRNVNSVKPLTKTISNNVPANLPIKNKTEPNKLTHPPRLLSPGPAMPNRTLTGTTSISTANSTPPASTIKLQMPVPKIGPNQIQKLASNSTVQKLGSQLPKKIQSITNANRPPPATIPLSKIKKVAAGLNNSSSEPSKSTAKVSQKIDNFGALDLSGKSSRLTGDPDSETGKKSEGGEKQPEQKNVHFSNLHILSESAVRIRDLMVSAQNKNMSSMFPLKKNDIQKVKGAQPNMSQEVPSKTNDDQKVVPKIETKPVAILSPKVQIPLMKKDQEVLKELGTTKPVTTAAVIPRTVASPKLINSIPVSTSKLTNSKPNEPPNQKPPPHVPKTPVAPTSQKPPPSNLASKPLGLASKSPINMNSIPNLQMLKIPVLQNSKSLEAQMKSLQKMPNLKEISKMTGFSAQIRATPNQAVRNIPNPSALMARQIQNRQNSQPVVPVSVSGGEETNGGTKTGEVIAESKAES